MKSTFRKRLEDLRGYVAIDSETTGLSPWTGDRPYLWTFFDENEQHAYVDWPVDPLTREVAIDRQDVRDLEWFIFQNEKVKPVFWNGNFDIPMARACGARLPIRYLEWDDAMFALHHLRSESRNLRLKDSAKELLGWDNSDESDLKNATKKWRTEGKKRGWAVGADVEQDYWMAPKDLWLKYGQEDVERTLCLWFLFLQEFAKPERERERAAYEREMELTIVTQDMQARGVYVRSEAVKQMVAKSVGVERRARREFEKYAGKGFNPGSPPQMGKLFYEKLGFEATIRTKTGKPSTSWDALRHFPHPVVRPILEWKSATKGLSTFFLPYLNLRDDGGILHTEARQCGTVTSRYSMAQPNFQQAAEPASSRSGSPIPIEARSGLGPRPGYVWYCFDYSQIEVRLFAWLAEEEVMLQTLRDGRDIHTETANRVYGKNPQTLASSIFSVWAETGELFGKAHDDRGTIELIDPHTLDKREVPVGSVKHGNVTPWDREVLGGCEALLKRFDYDVIAAEKFFGLKRTRAKTKLLLFGKIYGIGPTTASKLLECTPQEAAVALSEFDRAFPLLARYMKRCTTEALREGCIFTVFGNRLGVDRRKAYRATNYSIQGTAAQVMKKAMRKTFFECILKWRRQGIDCGQVLTVHDEQIIELPAKAVEQKMLCLVRDVMEDIPEVDVELPTECEVAVEMWSHKEKVDLPPTN